MKRIDATADLQDGIEPAPGPTPQADGLPGLTAKRPELPPRPRLCEQGPCRNYHRLEMQVESESPRAQRVPVRLPVLPVGAQEVHDGTLYQAPATFHTSVSHYCYPDIGIETVLGDAPVVHCNRWSPMHEDEALETQYGERGRYMQSTAGREYQRKLDAWELARAQEAQDASEADALIADSLIDAQMERYTFAAIEGDELALPSGPWIGGCDGFPRMSLFAETEDAVMRKTKSYVREMLRQMHSVGTPFPEPPPKENQSA